MIPDRPTADQCVAVNDHLRAASGRKRDTYFDYLIILHNFAFKVLGFQISHLMKTKDATSVACTFLQRLY